MSEVLEELKYVETHEWVRIEEDGVVTVGITDHAQHALGDIVFVELPSEGDRVVMEEQCGVVESVKAASEIYSPLTGEVVAANEILLDKPELINTSPYEEGWLFKIKLDDDSEVERLLTADQYVEILKEEEE
jgi:glycine cleavage system H protein